MKKWSIATIVGVTLVSLSVSAETPSKSTIKSTIENTVPALTQCIQDCIKVQSCINKCRKDWNGGYCQPRSVAYDCQGMNCSSSGKIKCIDGYCVCPKSLESAQ